MRRVLPKTATMIKQVILALLLLCNAAAYAQPDSKIEEKHEPLIEDVNARQLEKLISEEDYVAVFWYGRSCRNCDKALAKLENIDDDTDHFGVHFVKINDKKLSKQYNIKTFPALTYFRFHDPISYEGDLMDEEEVLEFLTSLEAMDLPDQIEEVNAKILDKVIQETDFVSVLFYLPQCKKSEKILKELENIDDEADQLGIAFVKIIDQQLAEEYSLPNLPALVYYRKGIPIVYEGDLLREEDVLEWLVHNKNTGDDEDVIEDVTSKTLESLISTSQHLAVLFYDHNGAESKKVLNELERIDDECDQKSIQFVKIDDDQLAKDYGVDHLPTLVYFEKNIPSLYDGDLTNEEQVLEWLIHNVESDEIEDITDEMLDTLIKKAPHLAVLFYDRSDPESETVMAELEKIDDECDSKDISFVKIDDLAEAKEYGIDDVPALVYFENGIPALYEGDLSDEDSVKDWLFHQVEADEIEDVTDEMLDMLISSKKHLAVLFYDKDEKESTDVLAELENIDDECDQKGITFVKIDNPSEAKEYGIDEIPSLVYFENGIPSVYEGDLLKEEDVLKWLLHQLESDEIEDVTDEMLDMLIAKVPHLAVLFYEESVADDEAALSELENIDDECDKHGIVFVKISNVDEAKEYGLDDLPALVYFENKIPSIYEGDLTNEEDVLQWLIEQTTSDTIEEVTDEILAKIIEEHEYVVVYFSGSCEEGEACDSVLDDLENIDDEADESGIQLVTTEETGLASKFGITTFPTLAFFRNGEPLIFKGDFSDEAKVLAWFTDQGNMELSDRIEEVNEKMLRKLIGNSNNVVAFFYDAAEKESVAILNELENIDDECDAHNIDFVKISDPGVASSFKLANLPSLVYYRRGGANIYEGDLSDEHAVLDWVLETKEGAANVIEEVDSKTLESLLEGDLSVVVYFYDKNCGKPCEVALNQLENIDDDAARHGIKFVKSSTPSKKIAIDSLPALIYFDDGQPIRYNDEVFDEDHVLNWILETHLGNSIKNVSRHSLLTMVDSYDYLAVIFHSPDDEESDRVLRRIELVDEEALTYGILVVKCDDHLMAKKYGHRTTPALVFFRHGKLTHFEGDLMDEEEVLDWLTDPDQLESNEHIERVNQKMFERVLKRSDFLAVFFYSDEDCKQCDTVLAELENIDDEAGESGVDFVKIDDRQLAREMGVFALPAVAFFRNGNREPVIYAGDLKNEERILEWILLQKDPATDVIEEFADDELLSFIRQTEYVAVYFYNKKDCDSCQTVLNELENIDDDTDRQGISFIKTQDLDMATNFGVTHFPALIYFENQVPSIYEGEILAEDVLQWLILQKTEDRIETVTRGMLESIVVNVQYLAVYFYKPQCKACDHVLIELENIDDECDMYGIQMVKIQDPQLAKRYSIKTFPALVYFRNGNPLLYDGDLRNEDSVLEWLVDDENRELADEIEAVNSRMLERLLDQSPFLAVFFYDDDCVDCAIVLAELENIDDEADKYGIDFVKINDHEAAIKYGITTTPGLIYFRKRTALIFDGDLLDENRVLSWLTSQDVFEIKDEIEEVNRKMLDKLLEENEFVAVYFYDNNCPKCHEAMVELEKIDDETDNLDITFVKIKDSRYARKYGVTKFPALVYFRRRFPSIYRGDLLVEEEVLEWLTKNRFKQPELNLFMYALGAITSAFISYTVFLMLCFKGPHQKTA